MARWLGIDIGNSSVRVALLRSGLRRTKVETLREEFVTEHGSMSAAIRAASSGLRADSIGTSISGERGFLRVLSLPAAAQKELASVLSFEVESTLPFELDDAVMDHRVLRRRPGIDDKTVVPLLAAVAYTHEVRDCIDLVRRSTGHEPQRIGLGSLPLSNLSQVADSLASAKATLFIELGDTQAELLILQLGEPRFARCLSLGVTSLPHDARTFARELRQSLGAWRSSGGAQIDQAYVVGSGCNTPGIEEFLHTEMGITITPLPPMALDGVGIADRNNLPRFAKAIALALGQSRRARDLTLRQGPLEAQHSYHFLREKTPLLSGLAAAIAVSFGFSIFASSSALEDEQLQLQDQLAAFTRAQLGQETTDPDRAADLLQATIAGRTADPLPDIDAFDVIVELSKRIPKEITHDIAEFDYNRGSVKLQGLVPTIDNAHEIAKNLGEYDCFQNVNITRTTRLKSQSKQKYVLELDVKCGGKKEAKKTKGGAKTAPKGGKSTKKKGTP